ncbi:efflux RND transporter periplasmic adaptor subunit [Erwinia sp. V71]|uniref:efflux RND transporter periplasmic adaptor subunit n=1 Tax=Enterobacterales TaxID=91347 RepID=UPI003F5E5859
MQSLSMLSLSLTCVLLAGCGDKNTNSSVPTQQVQAIRAPLAQYQSGAEITGEVKARYQANLAFRTNGRVTERLVDTGYRVKKGDVLARLDDTEKRADVEIAQAELRSARATLKLKQSVFARNQKLLPVKAISQATWDQSRQELLTAEASMASAKASLDTALDASSFTVLRADANGIITSRNVEVGQVVSSAQTVFTLAQDGQHEAVFQVFEAYFLHGQPLTNVDIALVTDRSRQIQAQIRELSPVLTEASGTIRIKATLPEDTLWPLGTPVVGKFHSPPQQGIVLPASAITSSLGMPAVWIIDTTKHSVSLREVTVSHYRSRDFIVTAGIAPQELIVTSGGKFLREGQSVSWEEH